MIRLVTLFRLANHSNGVIELQLDRGGFSSTIPRYSRDIPPTECNCGVQLLTERDSGREENSLATGSHRLDSRNFR